MARHATGAKTSTPALATAVAGVFEINMQRSIDFYTAQIGLELESRYGDEFAGLQGPGITIGLHPTTPQAIAGSVSIGLGVDDVEEGRRLLQARGVAFSGDIVADPPMRFAFLNDPDGVPLYLAEQSEFL